MAVFACACAAFWGQCHLGELLPTSSSPFRAILEAIPNCLAIRLSEKNKTAWVLHLPCTKTSPRGQDIILVQYKYLSNCILAIQQHLLCNIMPCTSTFFAYYTKGQIHTLTKKAFLEHCNQIWAKFGHPHITGHCFQISGTMELLLAKIPPEIIKTMG